MQIEHAPTTINGLPGTAIRDELARVLQSRVFIHSHRIRRFLQFVVDECLMGRQHRLKEYMIGLEVFNRREAFDPRVDSIVRVEARRLRGKLEEYYRTEGFDNELRIDLRKGSYVPLFEPRRAGFRGYGNAPTPVRRGLIALRPFSTSNGEPPELLMDLARRLTHVLINEGSIQVIPQHHAEGAESPSRADYILEGHVEQSVDGVRLTMQLLNVSDGAYFWSASGTSQELETLARSLNRALVTTYSHSVRLHRRRAAGQSFDSYLQGRYQWKQGTPESIRVSAALFAKAVERDPAYAAAWAALAESVVMSALLGFSHPREAVPLIRQAAAKAAHLHDGLPEAHVAMGASLSLLDWEWEAGEREFQRAIQLDGRDPSVHLAYAIQLACRGISGAALAETERGLDLDPASLPANFVLGWLRSVIGRHDEAIAHHGMVSRLAPDFALAYLGLGWAHAGKGLYPDALAYFTNASNLLKCRPLLAGAMGYCYGRMGQVDAARRVLAQLGSQPPGQYVSPVSLAAVHSGLGETDQAFTLLEQAADLRDCCLAPRLLNPEFDPLRTDGRWRGLLSRIRLATA